MRGIFAGLSTDHDRSHFLRAVLEGTAFALRDAQEIMRATSVRVTGGGMKNPAWRQIVAEVTRLRPTLGHLLDDARVVSDEGGRLTVAVPGGGAFVRDRLREPATRELLVEVARRTRADLRDVSVTAGQPPGGAPAGVADHPVVQAAMELFNGEVAAVRPAAPPDDRGGPAVEDAPPDREEA